MNVACGFASFRARAVAVAQHGQVVRITSSTQPWRSRTTQASVRAFSRSSYLRDDSKDGDEKPRLVKPFSAQRAATDRPWHREDGLQQPKSTSSDPSKGDSKKGRVLTTPTRLLKLILPMPFHPEQEHINASQEERQSWSKGPSGNTVEPLALLAHPQQPLSYLERLIQAEIPPIQVNGREKLPEVTFRAEADYEEKRSKTEKKETQKSKNGDNVAAYSGLGREGPERGDAKWVRWSTSTEVGDFIRDAARGREFAIGIEGHNEEIRIAVPSFRDRTYYMRVRLRKMSRQIEQMAEVKQECDNLAHKGAHRIAQAGFGALAVWWGTVYFCTFHTEMGWDLLEPVTYLAGLGTIMGGYLWFLFMSRDLSYKAAMNLTVTRRQNALYQAKGLDLHKWERLVHDANMLRGDIKMVANEYDVEWDEMSDLGSEEIKKVLEKEKKGKRREDEQDEEDEEEEDDRDDGPKEKEESKKKD